MKKFLALFLSMLMLLSFAAVAQADEEITISILTARHTEADNEIQETWFFKYLDYWLEQQGINVEFELEQTYETDTRISLMLATGSIPDLVWSINLGATNTVIYGATEKMLLDWTPYLNEETMPNAYALMQENPDAFAANTCIDGAIYSLPHLTNRAFNAAAGTMPPNIRVYYNAEWLEQLNLEVPTTMDETLDVLRAFKENIVLENGKEVIPVVQNGNLWNKYLWSALGYYGATVSDGTQFAIKGDKVYLPAATEDFGEFVKLLNTMYTEGLISPDYYTMDGTTAQGYMADGVCGVLADWTLAATQPETFAKWTSALPVTSAVCDKNVASLSTVYRVGSMYASAETEHPEVLAKIVDYLYSPEGATMYYYGPMQGQDPLGLVDGWYYDENGNVTTKMVEEGLVENFDIYCKKFIYSYMYPSFLMSAPSVYSAELAGVEIPNTVHELTDAVTGKTIETFEGVPKTEDNADGVWRWTTTRAWYDNCTTVMLPIVYLTEEQAERAGELKTVIDQYVKAELAKFVVGTRPLEELDQYYEELKKLGVDEYVEIYTNAYSTYMNTIFGA